MTRFIRLGFASMLILCTLAWPIVASGGIVNPVVDFGTAYAVEGSRIAGDHNSTFGDELVIVGTVDQFQEPFQDLDPHDPLVEYTFVMEGLISQGTVTTVQGPLVTYDTNYLGGTFRIYRDVTPDADFANPATFGDGEMILAGAFVGFHIATYSFTCSGTQNSDFQFTGGTLFPRVSDGGVGLTGIDTGMFSVCSSLVPPAVQALGYFALSDTKLDVTPPVPVEPTTWGRLKHGN